MACEINHAPLLPHGGRERKCRGRRIFWLVLPAPGDYGEMIVKITLCTGSRDWKRFEEVAEDLHGARRAFTPPFPGTIAKFLKPDSAFHARHGEIIPMVASRNGKPAGRIAAIINRSHNALHRDTTGFFGFWECEDDPATAQALFDAAACVLRERGLDAMRGPYNPSVNDECGLLVEGCGEGAFVGLVWNPEFYQSLIEGCGFRRMRSL